VVLADFTIFIPCRRNSKGAPFKNRRLFDYTIQSIPLHYHNNILVSTDDETLVQKCQELNIRYHTRSVSSARDEASTREVLQEALPLITTRHIIMLYLTYPERSWEDVLGAIEFFEEHEGSSMLCSKKLKTSPYLMMHKNGHRGRQLINHDLYRRQDYPECFEISHYIFVASIKEINNLNNNLYNEDTLFYPIDSVIDIDTESDMENFNATNKNNS